MRGERERSGAPARFRISTCTEKWRQHVTNKNIKTRPISAPDRNGVLLFASPRRLARSSSFNFHYHGLFSDLICCPVRSTHIGGLCCLMQSYFFFSSTERSTHISQIENIDSFAKFTLNPVGTVGTATAIFRFSDELRRTLRSRMRRFDILIIFGFCRIMTHFVARVCILRFSCFRDFMFYV